VKALSALDSGKDNVAYNVLGAFRNEVHAKFADGPLLSAAEVVLQSLL